MGKLLLCTFHRLLFFPPASHGYDVYSLLPSGYFGEEGVTRLFPPHPFLIASSNRESNLHTEEKEQMKWEGPSHSYEGRKEGMKE